MRVSVLPLDERPVCTTLIRDIAAVAGVTVELPHRDLLSHKRDPGDIEGLTSWLTSRSSDASVVSLDCLGFGGLIPSRIGLETTPQILSRWAGLSHLAGPVHAFNLIPRTPNADDADEEPEYWAQHGRSFHQLSAQLHRERRRGQCAESGSENPETVATGQVAGAVVGTVAGAPLEKSIPQDARRDWIVRRMRQHALSLEAMQMTLRGELDSLVIGIDDAAAVSLSASDAALFSEWSRWAGNASQIMIQPGADEIGTVLATRAIGQLLGGEPVRIALLCADPYGLDRIALYETGIVRDTAVHQIEAAGAVLVEDPAMADAVIVIHAPAETQSGGDWAMCPPDIGEEDIDRAQATARLVDSVGLPLGLADVSEPNGANPALINALGDNLAGLAAFAAWNTAGNTLGTVTAHLVTGVLGRRSGSYDHAAHRRQLAHRVVEDYGYMSVVRSELRAQLGSDPSRHDHIESPREALRFVGERLAQLMGRLPGCEGFRIVPGSLRFPWDRSFEIDFVIEEISEHPAEENFYE